MIFSTFHRGHELSHFKSYSNFRVDKKSCDIIYSKPTIIIKLDAGKLKNYR